MKNFDKILVYSKTLLFELLNIFLRVFIFNRKIKIFLQGFGIFLLGICMHVRNPVLYRYLTSLGAYTSNPNRPLLPPNECLMYTKYHIGMLFRLFLRFHCVVFVIVKIANCPSSLQSKHHQRQIRNHHQRSNRDEQNEYKI